MPRLDLWARILWAAVIVAQAALVFVMARSGLWRRYIALFSFLCLRSATSLMLFALWIPETTDFTAGAYFYVYWASAGIGCCVRVWMIQKLIAATLPIRRGRWLIWTIPPALALCFLIPAVLITLHGPMRFTDEIVIQTIRFGRVTSITWVLTFAALAYGCEYLGPRWIGRDRTMATGVAFQAAADLITSWMLGIWPSVPFVSNMNDLCYIASLGVWLYGLLQSEAFDSIPDLDTIREIAKTYARPGQLTR